VCDVPTNSFNLPKHAKHAKLLSVRVRTHSGVDMDDVSERLFFKYLDALLVSDAGLRPSSQADADAGPTGGEVSPTATATPSSEFSSSVDADSAPTLTGDEATLIAHRLVTLMDGATFFEARGVVACARDLLEKHAGPLEYGLLAVFVISVSILNHPRSSQYSARTPGGVYSLTVDLVHSIARSNSEGREALVKACRTAHRSMTANLDQDPNCNLEPVTRALEIARMVMEADAQNLNRLHDERWVEARPSAVSAHNHVAPAPSPSRHAHAGTGSNQRSPRGEPRVWRGGGGGGEHAQRSPYARTGHGHPRDGRPASMSRWH
jgi:hypothetical protein